MLRTLSNLPTKERESLLASVAKRLLPQASRETEQLTEAEKNLLMEMREKIGLSPGDNSPEAQAKLIELLNNEMSEQLRTGQRSTEAKVRLGERIVENLNNYSFISEFNRNSEHYLALANNIATHSKEVITQLGIEGNDNTDHLLEGINIDLISATLLSQAFPYFLIYLSRLLYIGPSEREIWAKLMARYILYQAAERNLI